MAWTLASHAINDVRHLLLKRHLSSIRIDLTRYNETRNKLQFLMPTKDIPTPKGLLLTDNLFRRFMPYIGGGHALLTLSRMLRDKYGDIVKFDSPTKERPCIFLFCSELCKSMYQSQGKYPMRIIEEPLLYYRKSRKDIYNGKYGLITGRGKSWQNFRSKINPYMLRPDIVKTHVKQIHEVASEFVGKMRKLRDPRTLELSNDFMNELNKWSLESKCSFVLNFKLGCLRPNFAVDSEPQIMISCKQEMTKFICRLENTSFLWKIMKMRNLKKLSYAMDTFHTIFESYIEFAETKIMKKTNKTNSEDRCVLENLLYVDRQTAHIIALDTLMNIDTTSNAAGALLYHIASNPKRQEKLREEIMSVFPDKTTPITHETLKPIPYVKACIKESLRLFLNVNGNLRTTQTDNTIGKCVMSKIDACHAMTSMDSMYFMRLEEFIPERWLQDPELPLYKSLHPFAYMPFDYGVRFCIGQRFVEIELEMLLLNVIRNFRIEWHHEPLEWHHGHETLISNAVKSPLRLKLIDF